MAARPYTSVSSRAPAKRKVDDTFENLEEFKRQKLHEKLTRPIEEKERLDWPIQKFLSIPLQRRYEAKMFDPEYFFELEVEGECQKPSKEWSEIGRRVCQSASGASILDEQCDGFELSHDKRTLRFGQDEVFSEPLTDPSSLLKIRGGGKLDCKNVATYKQHIDKHNELWRDPAVGGTYELRDLVFSRPIAKWQDLIVNNWPYESQAYKFYENTTKQLRQLNERNQYYLKEGNDLLSKYNHDISILQTKLAEVQRLLEECNNSFRFKQHISDTLSNLIFQIAENFDVYLKINPEFRLRLMDVVYDSNPTIWDKMQSMILSKLSALPLETKEQYWTWFGEMGTADTLFNANKREEKLNAATEFLRNSIAKKLDEQIPTSPDQLSGLISEILAAGYPPVVIQTILNSALRSKHADEARRLLGLRT